MTSGYGLWPVWETRQLQRGCQGEDLSLLWTSASSKITRNYSTQRAIFLLSVTFTIWSPQSARDSEKALCSHSSPLVSSNLILWCRVHMVKSNLQKLDWRYRPQIRSWVQKHQTWRGEKRQCLARRVLLEPLVTWSILEEYTASVNTQSYLPEIYGLKNKSAVSPACCFFAPTGVL